jgi:hypothetical protein
LKFQQDSQILEDVDIQELLHSCAAALIEEELQQLTVHSEPKGKVIIMLLCRGLS